MEMTFLYYLTTFMVANTLGLSLDIIFIYNFKLIKDQLNAKSLTLLLYIYIFPSTFIGKTRQQIVYGTSFFSTNNVEIFKSYRI